MTKEKKKEYLIISFLPSIMLAYSVIFTNPSDLIKGMKHILLSDGVLLTDYFVVGGKGASMFNASVVALINIFILYKMDMKINGLLISGIYIMFGFAFMGKNLLNVIPFYLGAYAYTQFEKRSFKKAITPDLERIFGSNLIFLNDEYLGMKLDVNFEGKEAKMLCAGSIYNDYERFLNNLKEAA